MRISDWSSDVCSSDLERWATDLCRIWGGRDGWLTLALVIDCHTRQLLGWQLSRSGRATTAAAALEQALITRYGTLGQIGRASCRERVCPYVSISVVAVYLKKKRKQATG